MSASPTTGATTFERTTPRLVEPDTEDNLQRQFLENRWTDGLPIVLPTEHRVAAMLPATSRNPPELIGRSDVLLSQTLQGGSEPGVTFMGSQGNSYTYNNVTFAENEERSPWEPMK